ncbi:MAG: hypothetical protein FWC70_12705 [Defluviitaleaceae bacterium]|nr:hypothetical protein [Defluviitaleaceae bacterium]
MKANSRLSQQEYEKLSNEYEISPPELSGKSGFLTTAREKMLIAELLPPDCARIVLMSAKVMSLSPAEVIQYSIKKQLAENAAGDGAGHRYSL